MANLASPFTTYSDTTPQKRVITDYISLIDPSDAPLVEALGGLDGAAGKFKFLNKGTKPEWLEDTLTPLVGAYSSSTDNTTSTATALIVADPNMFQEGHIIKVDSEQMWVSGVNGATSTLTVTRNYGGTQSTHATGSAVHVIGIARLEGADSDDLGFTDRTAGSNYTQIFHQEVKVTATQQVIDQYGIGDEFDYQSKKAIPSLMRLVERQLFNGVRQAGSATAPRAFGGLTTFITDNKVAGTSLVQSHFEAAVMSAYIDGGTGPWLAPCFPTNLQKVKNFYDTSNFLRVDPSQSQVGMVIDEVVTPFGNVKLQLNRWALSTEIALIDLRHAGLLTLRPWTQEPLAKTGDSIKGQVVGEFTFCMRQDKAHALLTAVS
jgi:hypothetical protein